MQHHSHDTFWPFAYKSPDSPGGWLSTVTRLDTADSLTILTVFSMRHATSRWDGGSGASKLSENSKLDSRQDPDPKTGGQYPPRFGRLCRNLSFDASHLPSRDDGSDPMSVGPVNFSYLPTACLAIIAVLPPVMVSRYVSANWRHQDTSAPERNHQDSSTGFE
jgi:hypothetical protein